MDVRCILCTEPVTRAATTSVAHEQEPICDECRTLSPEDRKALRDRAMTRMIRDGD